MAGALDMDNILHTTLAIQAIPATIAVAPDMRTVVLTRLVAQPCHEVLSQVTTVVAVVAAETDPKRIAVVGRTTYHRTSCVARAGLEK